MTLSPRAHGYVAPLLFATLLGGCASSASSSVPWTDASADAAPPTSDAAGGGVDAGSGPRDAATDSDLVDGGWLDGEAGEPWTPEKRASTKTLCVLAGTGAARAAGQEATDFLGTDLGWTYRHGDRLEFLFGDSWATPLSSIDSATQSDDAFASLSLARLPNGDAAEAHCAAGKLALELGVDADGHVDALEVGHVLDGFKTPIGGFSDVDAEVGVFFTGKPRGCASDADCDGLRCDVGLGFIGEEYFDEQGLTLPCVDGSSARCLSNTMANSLGQPIANTGLCVDPEASVGAADGPGRLASVATVLLAGERQSERHRYTTTPWLTTRFMNSSITTVTSLEPGQPADAFDYARPAQDAHGAMLLFGRPHFVGVGANGRSAKLYVAVAPLPLDGTDGAFPASLRYFAGTDAAGAPTFSANPLEAAAVDLTGPGGDSTAEALDVVNQMTVRWVPAMERWVMIYGGGISTLPNLAYPNCGVLEYFVPGECDQVDLRDAAIHMRTAANPWGPWTEPEKVLVGGNSDLGYAKGVESEYAPGGLLHHPNCNEADCAPHDELILYSDNEYGFLYGANLIEEWTEVREQGVDLYWNVSSWDPYRVSLVKTFVPWSEDD